MNKRAVLASEKEQQEMSVGLHDSEKVGVPYEETPASVTAIDAQSGLDPLNTDMGILFSDHKSRFLILGRAPGAITASG